MFERYTEPARRVVFFARYEAAELGSSSIGTEHLLLGLLWVGEDVAAEVLARNGLRLARVRDDIVQFLREAKTGSEQGDDAQRQPKIGDIVHYHKRGERGLVAAPAIVTSVLIPEQGK